MKFLYFQLVLQKNFILILKDPETKIVPIEMQIVNTFEAHVNLFRDFSATFNRSFLTVENENKKLHQKTLQIQFPG